MPSVWTDGVFEIEVDVTGRIDYEGGAWEVGVAPLRGREFLQVFRQAASPHSYFFLAQRRWDAVVKVHLEPAIEYDRPSLAVWRERLKLSLELGAWGRALWFDEQGQVCSVLSDAEWLLFLLPDGRSVWGQIPALWTLHVFDTFPFDRSNDAPHLQESTARDWLGWVSRALNDSTDCHFAFSFARLDHHEKLDLALTWRWGDYRKFEHICRCVAWLSIAWDEPWDGQSLSMTIYLDDSEDVYVVSDSPMSFPNIPDITNAERMWPWVLRISSPKVRPSLQGRQSVTTWLERLSLYIELEVSPPTAHERTEAIVSLRQWAQELGVENELLQMLDLRES